MSSETLSTARSARDVDDPDEAIVERVRLGETSLYEVLIRRYNQRMYRVARAILGGEEGVEDAMQDAYLRAFLALPRFQGRAHFSTWLTRILINSALGYRRSRSRHAEVPLETLGNRAAESPGTAHRDGGLDAREMKILQDQVGRLIEQTLETLPSTYRVVFVLRELEEMSVAQTAECLGISPVNAKVRLHRAKKMLREELRRRMPDIGLYSFLGERCDSLTRRVMTKIEEVVPLYRSDPLQGRIQAALPRGYPPGE
jgi:RNA polymerase sigma-70 factor, ECF subfamily